MKGLDRKSIFRNKALAMERAEQKQRENQALAKLNTLQVPERPSSQASSFPVKRLCSAVVLISQTGSFSAARMGLPQHSGTLAPLAFNSFFFPQVSHSNLRLSAMTPP
jgi:hypothetical protein